MDGGNPGSHGYQESERRRFFYRDVEDLIRVGFLQARVKWGHTQLVLRSISDQSHNRLMARTIQEPPAIWMQWVVAHSLYMVDGLVLDEDPNTPYYVKKYFVDSIPKPHLLVLWSAAMGLRQRVFRAGTMLEAFCYEPFSRTLWRTRNYCQEHRNGALDSWIAFHEGEDSRETDRSAWVRTQTIVGATSGKAAKQVRRSLEQEEQKEEARRTRVIEELVNYIINGERQSKTVTIDVNGQKVEVPVMRGAQTIAELEEEMRKAMEGELDGHDLQVQEYEEAIRAGVRRKAALAAERQKKQEQMGDLMRQAGIGGKTNLVGYDATQIPGAPKRSAGVKVQPTASSSRRLFDRYLKKEVGVGVIGSGGTPQPKDASTPLAQRLEGRKVSLSSEPIPSGKGRGSNE